MRNGEEDNDAPAGPEPAPPARRHAAAQVFVDDLDALDLTSADEHHLGHVLRLRPGEAVVAADGSGHWRACRLAGPGSGGSPGTVRLEPDGAVGGEARPTPDVTVGFVPVKGERPEWVVQKLTESGVDRIVVLGSRRSVVRWDGERGARALERLRLVARAAAAQSRRVWLPEVVRVADLEALASLVAPVPLAVADFGGEPPSTRAPAVAVGPEGGWDPAEVSGHPRMGLGPTVLRAETAAVAAGLLLCALREGLVSPAPAPPGPSWPGTNR